MFMRFHIQKEKKNWVKHTLRDGTVVYVNPFVDDLLREGYEFNKTRPKRLRKLFDILERELFDTYNGNVSEMSRDLQDMYGLPDYKRERMYEWLPILKKNKEEREIRRIVRDLSRKGKLEKVKKASMVREVNESLGSESTEEIYKHEKVKNFKKRKKMMDMGKIIGEEEKMKEGIQANYGEGDLKRHKFTMKRVRRKMREEQERGEDTEDS